MQSLQKPVAQNYSRTPIARTLKGNEKQFELAVNFSEILNKGKEFYKLPAGGEFELSEFELSRFYCCVCVLSVKRGR